MNQVIRQMGSTLYGVEDITDDEGKPDDSLGWGFHEMPSFVRDVLSVKVDDLQYDNDAVTWLRDWTFDKNAPQSVSNTGKALYLYDDLILADLELNITVSQDPVILTGDGQFFSETTLPASCEDILFLLPQLACWRAATRTACRHALWAALFLLRFRWVLLKSSRSNCRRFTCSAWMRNACAC